MFLICVISQCLSQNPIINLIYHHQLYINIPNVCQLNSPDSNNYFIKPLHPQILEVKALSKTLYSVNPRFKLYEKTGLIIVKSFNNKYTNIDTQYFENTNLPSIKTKLNIASNCINYSELPEKLTLNVSYESPFLDSLIKPYVISFDAVLVFNQDSIITLNSIDGTIEFDKLIKNKIPKLVIIDRIKAKIQGGIVYLNSIQYEIKPD